MWFFNRPSGIKTFLKILAALAGFLFLFLFSSSVSYPLPPGLGSFQGADAPIAQEAIPEQPFTYPVSFLNDRARDITGAAAVNAPGFIVPGGLTGEGQIVAIADSGLDIGSTDDIHPDLKSRPGKMPKIVLLKSWAGRDVPDDPDGHGTHMAATIAGTGAASDGKFKGVAPGASIYFQAILNKDGDIGLPGNLYDLFWPAYSAGARIHVDAWGGGPDTYLKPAAQVDEFVRNHPDFLVIFGAGNSGPSSATLTSEANSKNALAVGASILPRPAFVPGANNTSAAADLSSRGPAGDGRIKPELLVPASAVISAKSRLVEGNLQGFPDYTQMQGTSMAAAVAGGSSAIVREYLKKYMNLATPSAALVKSALINGARSAQGGPSKEGFGIIDLAGTLIALKEGSIHLADEWAGVTQGNEVVYTLHVSDSNAPLKATLAWTDPPVEPGSGRTLVNDLDLIVKTPDGRVYYGNHFLGQNTPDRTNNVEQVYLPAPVPGDYTVRVAGAAVQQNTVRAGTTVAQDFALAWGRTPVESMMTRGDNRSISLANGSSFSPADVPVVNLIDDSIAPSDAEHFFPGAEVFRAPDRAYIITRLWRAAGVKVLKTAAGFVFTEINLAVRLGGYNLAPDEGGVLLNNYAADPDKIPPGVEVSAVINPREQNIRQVRASYIKKEGVVLAVDAEEEEKTLTLAGDEGTYRVSPTAVYSYEDTYTSAETADAPFGTGALEELKDVLPGMPVSLQLAPSSGDIQYLTVKRNVALGTVYKTVASTGEIILENGDSYKIFPGAMVKRDRETCSFEAVKPGDHVSAVLLPDTGEVIGLVAFSKVLYGRVIDFSSKNRTVYLLDDNGRYHSFGLPGSAVIYRWGVRATANTIAVGGRVRVVTDPAGREVWRLDLAETLFDKSALLKYNGAGGVITTSQGVQYRLSGSTRFYKNGCPALPEDLLPGEQLELEYTAAPFPAGNVLFTVNCRSAAPPPALLTSIVTL
ncbi:MAG: S8 family serine peptidase, partial [Peptococcaceae bacterium]|nr:S8 family serine peptidase [Peptococcaceae bacterium]